MVVGGGYIGVEMAEKPEKSRRGSYYCGAGRHVIAPLDYDMACDVHRHLRENGVTLILQNGVQSIAEEGSKLKVTLSSGQVETDMVILAVGVRPDTALAQRSWPHPQPPRGHCGG